MGNRDIFNSRNSAFSPHRLRDWEMGFQKPIGADDAMAKSLYCGMKPIASWESDNTRTPPTGGVFNLEFSPDGSLLVAACEKKSLQIFDPLTHQRTHCVTEAHSDCVNCVKFLDARMFATCSDDTTVALWDVRNMKKKIRSLLGHLRWVKSIEFSVKDKLLVTSGLDGSIYTWDINSYTECNLVYQRVFHTSSLMRCRLSPDARKMVLCTTGGLIIIIHDLNLSTLAQDLHGFKPNLYKLMQMSKQLIPIAAMYDHLFDSTRKENRIEFVSDFPDGNDAEVISALQIHPQGWSALSRNLSHEDRSEWTCIHDIQPEDACPTKPTRDTSAPPPRRNMRRFRLHLRLRPSRTETAAAPSEADPEPEPGPSGAAASATSRLSPQGLSSIQNDLWEASITVKQNRMLQDIYSRGQVRRNFNMQRITGINTGITPPSTLRARHPRDSTFTTPSTSGHYPREVIIDKCVSSKPFIRQNKDRLLYYIEETNEGRGFIKELCYSADGRIVCSPFGCGMRLLALNQQCSELPHLVQDSSGPRVMTEVGQSLGIHQDLVVSSRFSPRYHMLVTGCLDGKIVWYQPYSGEDLY
ncbi:DDB1- and CUL4-associated factor 10 isoform X2 [Bombyx mandarina]|uniref:DDB1- and CUL4-associated factor 10 homolog n=2 Tax=Bombyx TaxID=7090 RepID=A0A8R1WIK5_BOMMO|nr:DDB1- and CUL4-associated factor 10 isoform X2 [Bombyx mori]XP_028031422.1 DDB1- and CUL4-associated factor 10 isoform X2 [Bombyx mandarina]